MKRIAPILLVFLCFFQWSQAQKGKNAANAAGIFSDLPFDDPASNSILHENEDALEKIKSNIFLRSFVSKKRCYIGEPILFTIQLYTLLQSTSTIVKQPYISGFLSNAVNSAGQTTKYKKEKGRNYRVFTILQRQLIPVQCGLIQIDNLKIENKVKYKDPSGIIRYYAATLSSDNINILVDSLPAKNKPIEFSGLTGAFTLSAFPRYNNVPAEKSNTLLIEITGPGNLIQAFLPPLRWPPGVDTFPVKETIETVSDSFPHIGRKSFEIPFVPQKEGTFRLPAINISYFDAASKAYKSIKSEPIDLIVTAAERLAGPVQQPVKPLRKSFPDYWPYYLAAIITVSLISILLYRRSKRLKKMNEQERVLLEATAREEDQKRQIEQAFKKELEMIAGLTDPIEFITAFKHFLTGYIQAKMGTSLVLEEELIKKIQAKDFNLATAVQELYDDCNTFLYAPGSLAEGDRFLLTAQLTLICKKVESLWG